MRKLVLLLACLLCITGSSLRAQITRQQAREAEWKSYSIPATNFTRQINSGKTVVFRVPADWKQEEGSDLTFRGPDGSRLALVVQKIPEGYPLPDYVASLLKGVRDVVGSTENLSTRITQLQDLEAREAVLESSDANGTLVRSVMWVTVTGPNAVILSVQMLAENAAAIEPLFKAAVQSLTVLPSDYSEFETLRSAAIKTPAPGPLNEIENVVDTLNQLHADRESAINRLTPLFLSQPDAALDLLLDRRVAVRSAAVEALARSKNVALKSFLWHMIDDEDPFVAEPAARRIALEPDVIPDALSKSTAKHQTEMVARLWPFLTKENQLKFVNVVFKDIEVFKDPKAHIGALVLGSTMKLDEFKTPLTRIMQVNHNPLTIVALRAANWRREPLPVNEVLKLASSANDEVKKLAVENLGLSASVADIPTIEKLMSKTPAPAGSKEATAQKAFDDAIKLTIKKINFRQELEAGDTVEKKRATILKASADLADFAWRFDCESTTAGCPGTTPTLSPDFKVKSLAENLFPKKLRHYAAIPNPAQTVQRFYETLHGLQLDSPRAQANLVLVMGGLREKLGQELGAPPDAAALIDYTGIKPDSPFVVGSWTAPGARDLVSSAERKALVVRVNDRERFERAVESLQQASGNFMLLIDYVAVASRAAAVLPALLPISAEAVLKADPDKPEVVPELKYSFIGQTEWNGIPIKIIGNTSADSNWTVTGAATHLAFVGDVAILTSDVATLRELLTNATTAEPQLLAGNEEFRQAIGREGDVVYFSDLRAFAAEFAQVESPEKTNESGVLKFDNSSWENSHRLVFDESDWSKPLVPFHPRDLIAPRDLLPSSTIAYSLIKLDVPRALQTWPKTMNLSNTFEKELSLFALDFQKDVAPELGPECGAAIVELPNFDFDKSTWVVFCKLKSNKLSDALTTGKLFRGVGPTTSSAEVKNGDTSYFVSSRNGFLIVSNNNKALAAVADKKNLASTRDYSRAAERAADGIVAFGGYNLEAAVNATRASANEGQRANVAAIIFSVASAFHSQSFSATASPGAIEGRSSVAMDREGRYAVADFSYLPRGANITYVTLEPHGAPIIDQTRISNLVLKVRAKATGPIDSIRDDIKTATQTVEQKSPTELVVSVSARRGGADKKVELPVTDPALAPFLKSTGEFTADDKAVVDQAKQIAGDDRDAWSVARKLGEWTHNNLVWKSVARAGAAETLASREADCSEFSQLFVAMARSLGLPARMVLGLAYSGSTFGGHAWVEVWVGEWVELDPTWGTDFVDATHIRNNESTLLTAAALNLIDLEVLETRRAVTEFQQSAKALAEHLVKVIPLADKPELEAALDLPAMTDEIMGQGAWARLNEHERDQVSSAYRRALQQILLGYGEDKLEGDFRLLHLEEKNDRAEATCLWVTADMLLKLQLVRRDNAWHLIEIVQDDSGLRIVNGTLGPTIKAIEDNRAGKRTIPAPFSEFSQSLVLIDRDVTKAIEKVDQLLKANPGDQSLRFLKAIALVNAEKEEEAAKIFRELSNGQPPHPQAILRLAGAVAETEPAEAIELYKRYSTLEPFDPRGYRYAASVYESTNQPALAEAAYRKAIEIDPHDRTTYINLINVLLANDRLAEVDAVFVASDKYLTADDDLLASTLSQLYDDIRLDHAERLAATQSHRMKASSWANLSLAAIYMREGKNRVAVDWLNRAAQLDKEYAEPHILLSDAYLKLSRLNEALKAAEQAVSLDPENGSAFYRRACALARLGRTKAAMADLEKAVELDPDTILLMEDDPDLRTLRNLPAFKKLLQEAEKQSGP